MGSLSALGGDSRLSECCFIQSSQPFVDPETLKPHRKGVGITEEDLGGGPEVYWPTIYQYLSREPHRLYVL